MPNTNNAKDEHKDSNGGVTQVDASVTHTKSGKVVSIRSHDKHLDAMGETLKDQQHNIPMVAVPGKFPLGRSTPSSPDVIKAESARQDAELAAAQKEVEQLKEQLRAAQAPDPAATPDPATSIVEKPAYTPKYGYGDGVGDTGGPPSYGS